MSKQRINVGTGLNTGTGDTLRAAMEKVNNNFDELYDLIGQDSTGKSIDIAGNVISSTFTNTDIVLDPNGTGSVRIDANLQINEKVSLSSFVPSSDSTTALSLDLPLQSLTPGEASYTLAEGTEGQIMYFVLAGGTTTDSSTGGAGADSVKITVARARDPSTGDTVDNLEWNCFLTNDSTVNSLRSAVFAIFSNGAWCLSNS
tara:strand:+ start:478 stop:1083 length:606 start_codon:yes stop_codon:yes gene_type:complete